MRKSSVVSVVRYFILILVIVKQRSERSQIFYLTVVKKDSVVSVVSEVKQRSVRSQIFHFYSSEVKQCIQWRQ